MDLRFAQAFVPPSAGRTMWSTAVDRRTPQTSHIGKANRRRFESALHSRV
jgi:hypothetical protein